MPVNASDLSCNRTLVSSLQRCALLKDLQTGYKLHFEIARFDHLRCDVAIGSSLVHMYSKCGLFAQAEEVLEMLPGRNSVSWNALIGGALDYNDGDKAIRWFEKMQLNGVQPDDVTFISVVKACQYMGIKKLRDIHAELARRGVLERNIIIGSNLVDIYARLGSLLESQEVFDTLCVRDVICWTALMRGYIEQGCCEKALELFEQMQVEGVAPDTVSYVCSLQACGEIGCISMGEILHAVVSMKGFLGRNLVLDTALINMYTRCGMLWTAQEIFDSLPVRNVVSWTSLINAYAECGQYENAINCFELMQHDEVSPNTATFLSTLKACWSIRVVDKGEEIHADIVKKGLFDEYLALGNALIDMYMKCGYIHEAQDVFNRLSFRSLVSWNTLVIGYADQGHGIDALKHFENVQLQGYFPDVVTYIGGLKACCILQDLQKGQAFHAQIFSLGLLGKDPGLGSVLIDMYVKCRMLVKAQDVFERIPIPDVIAWSALIGGYAEAGNFDKTLMYLEKMQKQGIPSSPMTFGCGLRVCSSIGAMSKGQEIHSEIERCGLHHEVGNDLVYMYAKDGWLPSAQEVFSRLQVRDVVSWNTLMTGYALIDHDEKILGLLDQLLLEGVSPDHVTLVHCLKACGNIGAINKGLQMHSFTIKSGILEEEPIIGNCLIDMYSRCGLLTLAQQVFDALPTCDVVSWNSLLAGHAQLGQSERVFEMLEKMHSACIKPSLVTMTIILSACGCKGLIERCHTYFEIMSSEYGIAPNLIHHACMVDLLSRSGQVHEAVQMIEGLPWSSDIVIWHAVLSGCGKWGSLELGREAFKHATCSGEHHAGTYMLYAQL
ncbi:hypothetical protein KP509_25G011600, partial [Ceratopteris richardii]